MRILLACLVPFLLAAEPVVIIQQDGTAVYWDGESDTATPVRVIRVTGDPQPPGPPTDPDDPDKPDPPTQPTSLSERVEQWARAVGDPSGAMLWMVSYERIADAIEASQNPSPDDLVKVLDQVGKATLAAMSERYRASWEAVDKQIERALTARLITASGAASKAEWVRAMREVAAGFEAVSGNPAIEELDPGWLTRVLQHIEAIIRIVKLLEGL